MRHNILQRKSMEGMKMFRKCVKKFNQTSYEHTAKLGEHRSTTGFVIGQNLQLFTTILTQTIHSVMIYH